MQIHALSPDPDTIYSFIFINPDHVDIFDTNGTNVESKLIEGYKVTYRGVLANGKYLYTVDGFPKNIVAIPDTDIKPSTVSEYFLDFLKLYNRHNKIIKILSKNQSPK